MEMHSDFPVILDACVLVNGALCDLYLRLAEPPRLYTPVWSAQILDEVCGGSTPRSKSWLIPGRFRVTRGAWCKPPEVARRRFFLKAFV